MDIQEYLKKFDESESDTEAEVKDSNGKDSEGVGGITAAEIKAEINKHLAAKEQVEREIPSDVTICSFYVSCEAVRATVSKKRKKLAKEVLKMLAKKLKKQADDLRL
jgi:aspartate ammonia-lyase